jgi:hypothetical protein
MEEKLLVEDECISLRFLKIELFPNVREQSLLWMTL